jgi:DNA-binding NarL/FixJ family response regulator
MITNEIAVLTLPKSCFRCGAEFSTSDGRERICRQCRKPKPERRTIASTELTTRERQIVGLVRFGKLNKEIAYELHLAEGTIKEYLNRIFRKVMVKNRTELAVWAFTHQVAA